MSETVVQINRIHRRRDRRPATTAVEKGGSMNEITIMTANPKVTGHCRCNDCLTRWCNCDDCIEDLMMKNREWYPCIHYTDGMKRDMDAMTNNGWSLWAMWPGVINEGTRSENNIHWFVWYKEPTRESIILARSEYYKEAACSNE